MLDHLHVLNLIQKRCIGHNRTCIAGAVGEALEVELNKAGPGSCKFVSCDISREEDIKVKCNLNVTVGVLFSIDLQS